MHYISCVLLNTEHWTIFSSFFGYLGSICMYVLFMTNPAVVAKSNKPLLLLLQLATSAKAAGCKTLLHKTILQFLN